MPGQFMDQIIFETHFGNSVLGSACIPTQTQDFEWGEEMDGVKTELKEGNYWVML